MARYRAVGNLQSATGAFAVTPADGTDLVQSTRALYLQGDAALKNVKVTMVDGSVVTFLGLATGVIHPLQVRRVWSTGTTATNILGLV